VSNIIRTVKLWEKGLITIGCGLLAFVWSMGGGPCGPSSTGGLVLMPTGMLAIPVGGVMLFAGMVLVFREKQNQ
jgi:hypothetical protein